MVSRATGPAAILLASGLLAFTAPAANAAGVGYFEGRANGVPVRVVQVDPRDQRVRVGIALPERGMGTSESFHRFVQRTRPVAAITGTYFDFCTARPLGDLVINGRYIHHGSIGYALTVTKDNRIRIVRRSGGRKYKNAETVLASGPRLVAAGKPSVYPRREGFKDQGLFRRTHRAAAGVTRSGKLLLVNAATPVSMWELARAMVKLGAVEAINLDGGSSTALYYGGKFRARPARKLTNVLVVYDNPTSYRRASSAFYPGLAFREPSGVLVTASTR